MLWETFQYALVIRNALSLAQCDELVREGERTGWHDGHLGAARHCDIAWVHDPLLTKAVADVGFNSVYGQHLELHRPFNGAAQISRYTEGGRYDWHMDLGPGQMSLRKATVVVELKSADEGGGLEVFAIGDLNLRVGDAAVFPSFIMHRAKPVISGERWSAAAWLLGNEPLR